MYKQRKKIIRFTVMTLCLALIGLFLAVGCEKKNEERYPKDITIIDYSLENPNCLWDNYKYDSLYVINSQQELFNLLYCHRENIPAAIDFNKYSLLFFAGQTDTTLCFIRDVSKSLQRLSWSIYKLNVEVCLDEDARANSESMRLINKRAWLIAILVPKLSQNAVAMSDVNIYQRNENNLPSGIIFTKKFMPEVDWTQYNINEDTIYIINSQMELQNLTGFSGNIDIDFTQYSILFVRGVSPNVIYYVSQELQQLSENNYKLNFIVPQTILCAFEWWTAALVVRKINTKDKIELNIIYK